MSDWLLGVIILAAAFAFGGILSMIAWNWPPHDGWKIWKRWPW